jgi:lysozyme
MAVSPLPTGGTTRVDTWDRIARAQALPDFSPDSQDRAAVALIDEAGALQDARAGRFEAAVDKVSKVWASMPGAGYAQPEKALADLRVSYVNAGGVLAG